VNQKKRIERRKLKRFRPQERSFVAFGSERKEIGHMTDISLGGLSFRYLADGDLIDQSDDLEIYVSGGGFYLKMIPFKTISDYEITTESPISFIIMRRRGIQFGKLTQGQTAQLTYFLTNYTLGEV
jgi:hypothetical protein